MKQQYYNFKIIVLLLHLLSSVHLPQPKADCDMKSVYLLILLSFFSVEFIAQSGASKSLSSESGEITCKYQLIYMPDSTSAKTRESRFILITDKKSSIFGEELFFKQDSLVHYYSKLPMNSENMDVFTNQLIQISDPNFSFSVYKNYALNKVTFLEEVNRVKYYYNEPDKLLKWTSTKDTQNISGYGCNKATTLLGGRQWEVWFTKEIPISDGPYKFYGLPGLIIKAVDSKKQYAFNLSSISQTSSHISVALPTGNTVATNKKDFSQAKKDYELSIPSRMAARGTAVPEALIQSYKERLKRNNNKIELN